MSEKKAMLMIIDDDKDFLAELGGMLELNGYDTARYHDAVSALQSVKKIRPDVILTDLKMSGMNGFQFVSELKLVPEAAFIPVLPMTGSYTEKEHNFLMRVCGLPGALIKPFQPEEVLGKIEEALNKRYFSRNTG
jgi:DNA-binding response OmpR family regulator